MMDLPWVHEFDEHFCWKIWKIDHQAVILFLGCKLSNFSEVESVTSWRFPTLVIISYPENWSNRVMGLFKKMSM